MNEQPYQPSDPQSSPQDTVAGTKQDGGFRIGLAGWTTLILMALIAFVRIGHHYFHNAWARVVPMWDNQISNMVTMLLVFLATASSLWFLFRRRWSLGGVALGGLVLAAILFRFEGFSGELQPKFAWRFSPAPVLPMPENVASDPATPDRATQANSADTSRTDTSRTDTSPTEALANDGNANRENRSPATMASGTPSDFPQFLGPKRNGVIDRRTFDTDWNATPPKLLWKQSIGAGWSGFAVAGDLAVTMEQRDQEQWVTCYQASTGKLRWKYAEPAFHSHPLGGVGPRSTPTIVNRSTVYALTTNGILVALDLDSGKRLLRIDLFSLAGISEKIDLQSVAWGRSASPLVEDGLVIVPFGKPTADQADPYQTLIALNATTFEVAWTASGDQVSYASPVRWKTADGTDCVVSVNEKSVAAYRIKTGEKLWSYPWDGSSSGPANCTNPLLVDNQRLIVSKGYGSGAMQLEVLNNEVTERWHERGLLKTKFTNPVIRDGYAYALSDGAVQVVDIAEGKQQWIQGRSGRYGQGQLLLVEDVLLVQCEEGDIALVNATPEGFEELARVPAITGVTWNNPALAGNLLLVRSGSEAAALQLPPRNDTH
jgi:outer membrane protein assembly factor BamB